MSTAGRQQISLFASLIWNACSVLSRVRISATDEETRIRSPALVLTPRTVILQSLILAVLCYFSLATAAWMIKHRPLSGDDESYVTHAHALFATGRYADEHGSLTQRREPAYSALLAVLLVGEDPARVSVRCLTRAQPSCHGILDRFKTTAAVLLVLSGLVVFLLVASLTGSLLLANVGFILVAFNTQLLLNTNALRTEGLATFLLTVTAAILYLSISRGPRWHWSAAAGVSLAALSLTKAMFLYAWPLVLLLLWKAWSRAASRRSMIGSLAVFLGCFAVLAGGWSLRNYIHFDTLQFAGRGGTVLSIRASYDSMSWEEMKNALYYWNPAYGHSYLRSVAERDSWRRLNRNQADGFYQHGKIVRPRELAAQTGLTGAALDAKVRRDALRRILVQPLKHLALTGVLAYRGLFLTTGLQLRIHRDHVWLRSKVVINVLLFGLALVTLIDLWRRRCLSLGGLFLLPAYSFAAHAVLTHNLTRYSEPMLPLLVLAACLGAWRLNGLLAGAPDPHRHHRQDRT